MKSKRRKIKTHEYAGIAIRELRPELPEGGGGYFQVDIMRDKKRERTGFDTLAKAKTHASILSTKIGNEGTSSLSLTPTQRDDAVEALGILGGKVTLTAAARLWARHNGIAGGVTVTELGRRWLVELKRQGCRDTTLAERGQKVGRLVADFGERTVAGMTRDDVTGWLTAKGLTGATWDSHRRAYRAMFQFAAEEKLVDSNPVAAIKPMRMDEKMPTPFTVDAATAIMRTAAQWTPALVPTLAVQFFGGLRPGEAQGLDWRAVDFKGKTIRIMPETSKVRRTRIIPMSAALAAWLEPYRKVSGPIGIQTKAKQNSLLFMKRIGPPYEMKGVPIAEREPDKRPKGLASAAGVEWIQDGPRKTFASAHYALYGDAPKLAAILGHTGGHDVLFRHYRGLMTKADGRRFFAIRPAGEKVIRANFRQALA